MDEQLVVVLHRFAQYRLYFFLTEVHPARTAGAIRVRFTQGSGTFDRTSVQNPLRTAHRDERSGIARERSPFLGIAAVPIRQGHAHHPYTNWSRSFLHESSALRLRSPC